MRSSGAFVLLTFVCWFSFAACAGGERSPYDTDPGPVPALDAAVDRERPRAPESPGFGGDGGSAVVDASASPDGGCEPCKVTAPGTFCGLDVGITPFVTGGKFGGFQSVAGTGYQDTITITFSKPITWASVKILDPDYPDNYLRVYDQNDVLRGQVAFDSDGTPNVLTDSTQGLGGGLIRKIELVPDPQDYVAYDDLTVIPAGCAPPTVQ